MVCTRSQYKGLCFFNDLGGVTECTFKEFKNNTKLGGLADSPDWCAVRTDWRHWMRVTWNSEEERRKSFPWGGIRQWTGLCWGLTDWHTADKAWGRSRQQHWPWGRKCGEAENVVWQKKSAASRAALGKVLPAGGGSTQAWRGQIWSTESSASQYKTDMNLLEWVYSRGMKLIKGMEIVS